MRTLIWAAMALASASARSGGAGPVQVEPPKDRVQRLACESMAVAERQAYEGERKKARQLIQLGPEQRAMSVLLRVKGPLQALAKDYGKRLQAAASDTTLRTLLLQELHQKAVVVLRRRGGLELRDEGGGYLFEAECTAGRRGRGPYHCTCPEDAWGARECTDQTVRLELGMDQGTLHASFNVFNEPSSGRFGRYGATYSHAASLNLVDGEISGPAATEHAKAQAAVKQGFAAFKAERFPEWEDSCRKEPHATEPEQSSARQERPLILGVPRHPARPPRNWDANTAN